jgi:CYTH domain-containing protein
MRRPAGAPSLLDARHGGTTRLSVGAHDGFEIERKYLLERAPSPDVLAGLGTVPVAIEQVYLVNRDGLDARRVRRLVDADGTSYRYTEKRHVRGIVRKEREHEIDAATFERLLAEADPARQPIRKTRHVFDYDGERLELDLFEGPLTGLVLLEIELDDENVVPAVPPELGPYRDVSEDPAFLNWNLARR